MVGPGNYDTINNGFLTETEISLKALHENLCEDCNGTGTFVDVILEPECCRNYTEHGECCCEPIPVEVPVNYQCETCLGTGDKIRGDKIRRQINSNRGDFE